MAVTNEISFTWRFHPWGFLARALEDPPQRVPDEGEWTTGSRGPMVHQRLLHLGVQGTAPRTQLSEFKVLTVRFLIHKPGAVSGYLPGGYRILLLAAVVTESF